MRRLNIREINAEALKFLPCLIERWLPDGRRVGDEWVALNPQRDDLSLESIKVNLSNGCWSDSAMPNVRGRSMIGLAAYLLEMTYREAARVLAEMLGLV